MAKLVTCVVGFVPILLGPHEQLGIVLELYLVAFWMAALVKRAREFHV